VANIKLVSAENLPFCPQVVLYEENHEMLGVFKWI